MKNYYKKQINYGGHFDVDSLQEEILSLNQKMNEPNFWNNKDASDKVIKRISELKTQTQGISALKKKIEDNLETLTLLLEENEEELKIMIEKEYELVKKKYEEIELLLLLNGEYDHNDCVLEIHSGAGGTEACDWAQMLYRMYTRYLMKKGYKIEELSTTLGEEVGIKSVIAYVKGNNAYGYLKGERGIHRLVRISPFDAGKRRHTSFASVEIIPQIDTKIDIQINEKDLKIDVYHSSGAGGQSVNTSDSAVRITHLPTGIVVTCQNERSQVQNREKALEILKSKLYQKELDKQTANISEMKSNTSINFGSGKRSYVMCPYTLVKDNDSNYETSDVFGVLDGDLDGFINANLKGGKNGTI